MPGHSAKVIEAKRKGGGLEEALCWGIEVLKRGGGCQNFSKMALRNL